MKIAFLQTHHRYQTKLTDCNMAPRYPSNEYVLLSVPVVTNKLMQSFMLLMLKALPFVA